MTARCVVMMAVVEGILGSMLLLSPDFENSKDIPSQYACDPYYPDQLIGPSPPLKWVRPPEKTKSFVLVVDDITADGYIHWLVSNIPAETREFEMDASRFTLPYGTTEYYNSHGDIGFALMCPVNATHIYRFRLYALRVPRFEFKSYHKYHSKFPITTAKVEAQLDAIRSEILYVATLSGQVSVAGVDPNAPKPSPSPLPDDLPQFPGDPLAIRRFIKPSETLKNKRPHYSPRPILNATTEEICRRYREQNLSPVYAQFCTPEVTPKYPAKATVLVERGGPEAPDPSAPARTPTTADSRKVEEPEDPTERGQTSTAMPLSASASDALVKEEENLLMEWDCENKKFRHEEGNPLRLRSPVIDVCGSAEGSLPLIPREFKCDSRYPSLHRASPPFTWKLRAADNQACEVHSYLLMLEDMGSQKINWLVKDIPASVDHLDVGMSGEPGNAFGVESLNSYKTDAFVAPCPSDSPQAYRVHLFAMPVREVRLLATDAISSTDVLHQINGPCHSTYIDFVVA